MFGMFLRRQLDDDNYPSWAVSLKTFLDDDFTII